MVTSTVWLRELWSTLSEFWEARDLHPHGDIRSRSGRESPRNRRHGRWRAELEKILWRPIVLRDIADEYIFNSGKYQRSGWKTVEIICHNGHAWPKDLHFPQSREVHTYEGNIWHAIWEVTQCEPLAVRLLGGQDRQHSVVPQDGRTYRTQKANERLKAICGGLGNPELADRAFGEKHAASIMAKEKNPSQPPPGHLSSWLPRLYVLSYKSRPLFRRALVCLNTNRKPQNLSPLSEMAENLLSISTFFQTKLFLT